MNETRLAILEAVGNGPISGPDLARRLDISRAAVWKHIEALREEGFVIESVDEGYALTSVPEYGGLAIEYGLDAPFSFEYHETIESTNSRAQELGDDGAEDVVVLADAQETGRGRLDRAWASPSGGIWMSLVLQPDLPPAHTPLLTLAAAVATARAIDKMGVKVGLKWPNDVLLADNERKLAGILTEMEGEADQVSWVVIGIGLNANVDTNDLPREAVSLRDEIGDVNRRELVHHLLEEFDTLRNNPDNILPAWRKLALTLNRQVRIDSSRGEITGKAVDISVPGALIVDTGEEQVSVYAGDCNHLRPLN